MLNKKMYEVEISETRVSKRIVEAASVKKAEEQARQSHRRRRGFSVSVRVVGAPVGNQTQPECAQRFWGSNYE